MCQMNEKTKKRNQRKLRKVLKELEVLRDYFGASRKSFASMIGVGRGAYSLWLRGKAVPHGKSLAALEAGLKSLKEGAAIAPTKPAEVDPAPPTQEAYVPPIEYGSVTMRYDRLKALVSTMENKIREFGGELPEDTEIVIKDCSDGRIRLRFEVGIVLG